MNINELFPYQVPFRREFERDWYGTRWPLLSTWCTDTLGVGEWEYENGNFLFKTEVGKTLFLLKWSGQ
jgi:hypothetical protein